MNAPTPISTRKFKGSALLTTSAVALTLAACGGGSDQPAQQATEVQSQPSASDSASPAPEKLELIEDRSVIQQVAVEGEFPITVSTISSSLTPRQYLAQFSSDYIYPASLKALVGPNGEPGAMAGAWSGSGWDVIVVMATGPSTLHAYRTPAVAGRDLSDIERLIGAEISGVPDLPSDDSFADSLVGRLLPGADGVTSGSAASTLESQQAQVSGAATSTAFGKQLGSFAGVAVFSNKGNEYGSAYGYNTTSGYKTGLKWQCTEFVSRYFWLKFGRKVAGGNANSFYGSASSKGLNRAPNGGTNGPQVGNIICSNSGQYGHCAIVTEVGKTTLKTTQQNWSNSAADIDKVHSLDIKVVNGVKRYYVGGFSSKYQVIGWMWPK